MGQTRLRCPQRYIENEAEESQKVWSKYLYGSLPMKSLPYDRQGRRMLKRQEHAFVELFRFSSSRGGVCPTSAGAGRAPA